MSGGRIRTIKPEILDDPVAADLSDGAWRLWVSLWVMADDHGNVRLDSRFVAAQVWQNTSRDPTPEISELIEKERVLPYAVKGQRYGHVRNWDKHQRVDNAGKPRVPDLSADDGTWEGLAAVRRESPRVSANLGEIPLRARAPSPTTDHRPPTTDPPAAAPAASSGVVSISESEGTKAMRRQAREGEYRKAYVDGIAEGGGGKIAVLAKHQGDLNTAITTFARDGTGRAYRDDELLAWIGCFAADFAEDIQQRARDRPEVRGWYSSLLPAGFAKWLAERDQAQMAKAIP